MKVKWIFSFHDPITGEIFSSSSIENMIVQGGYENLASLLIGQEPSETAAMYCVIGANDTLAKESDTIENMDEVARKAITAKTCFGGTARFRTFFQTNEANGNHKCFGLVARGTEQPNSGILLNRLVVPFSKTENAAMTIEVRWDFKGV